MQVLWQQTRPISSDLSDQRTAKVKLLKEQLVKSGKKLTTKEEELKCNELDLVAKSEELEKAQTKIGQLRGELPRLREEVRSLRPQLEQANIAVTNAVSEYHTSEEMVALKKSLLEKGFEEGAQAFTYIVATARLDWDLAFLGEHLID